MITTSGLTKVYRSRGREVTALDGVDLHVREGEVYGVIGQSGAGKSSLIRCVNLLERPTSGTVTVAGQDLTALAGRGPRAGRELRQARSRIGMVFQHFNLLSSRTVQDNVELPLEILGKPAKERSRKALELLDLVGLADKAKAYPAQLSGGQKQRVGIARALAGDPKVLLSDEATSALDPETTRSILHLLRDLNRQLGLTVLLITHEMDVVKSICDSAALMENGRITESGTVTELLATPAPNWPPRSSRSAARRPATTAPSSTSRSTARARPSRSSPSSRVPTTSTYRSSAPPSTPSAASRSAGCASNCPAATRTTSSPSASCANRACRSTSWAAKSPRS
ncbi:hypothetical protein SHKM778_63720 [Streptomyces sp. KM77-8]|uniref:ABC transporter domain-containing protein n=1 Tax=Streptomyces haneummycinicus TaxID=3074435 RepID=A0AAT9HRA1_9ACTN